ncbi:MAG: WecB/TagA/CpsF family glycosyltransferase [Pleurocapsa sp.]
MNKSVKSQFSSAYLLNRRVDLVTSDTVIQAICQSCGRKQRIIISHYNIHAFNLSMLLPEFLTFQQNADITLCDGMGMIKGLELTGVSVSSKYRVPLTLMIPKLLKECEQHKISVFLLGSEPENLAKALNNQQDKYPNLSIAGHHGYFDYENTVANQTVIKKINQFQPDILIVGMGMPLQELWIQNNYQDLKTLVIIPSGAVIDRLAGVVQNSPQWMSNAGLEWLYRLSKEPKRLAARYILGNPLFLLNIFWAKYQDFYFTHTTRNEVKPDISSSKVNQITDSKINSLDTKINYL